MWPIEIAEGGDAMVSKGWWGNRKMTPYTKKGLNDSKFRTEKYKGMPGPAKGISEHDKLVTRNANRSKKKAYRQQLKKELQDELQSISG